MNQKLVLRQRQRFREDIRDVFSGPSVSHLSVAVVNELADPMPFDTEVFGAGVMGGVLYILHVVIIDMDRLGAGQSELLEQVANPQGSRPWTRIP